MENQTFLSKHIGTFATRSSCRSFQIALATTAWQHGVAGNKHWSCGEMQRSGLVPLVPGTVGWPACTCQSQEGAGFQTIEVRCGCLNKKGAPRDTRDTPEMMNFKWEHNYFNAIF